MRSGTRSHSPGRSDDCLNRIQWGSPNIIRVEIGAHFAIHTDFVQRRVDPAVVRDTKEDQFVGAYPGIAGVRHGSQLNRLRLWPPAIFCGN